VAALLCISSEGQLDLPCIHSTARTVLENMFAGGPRPFDHPPYAEAALALATEHKITSVVSAQNASRAAPPPWSNSFVSTSWISETQITKGLFYSIVKSSEFDAEERDLQGAEGGPPDIAL
jgi:hypothetical protein